MLKSIVLDHNNINIYELISGDKMKIAYFIDTVIPSQRANTVHVMRMCQALKRNGHEVVLVCDKDKEYSIDSIWKQYGIDERFNLVQIKLPSFIRNHGHRFSNVISAKKKAYAVRDYDYAYGRSAYSLFFLKEKKRYIYEAHNEPDALNRFFEKRILQHKNCKGLVVISQSLKRRYMELFPFIEEHRITVLHDCADIDETDCNNKVELHNLENTKAIKIGYLGHLYPGKCMEILSQVALRCKDLTFHVVGGTSEWVIKWKEYCLKRGIDNIVFYGFVNNSEIGKYYRAFDISILPFSKSVFLGTKKAMDIGRWISPLKLFEAMSYKKPILVSKLPTIEEVIEDGYDGLLADPDDINEWVNKLYYLVENTSVRETLGMHAYTKLKNDYTWQKRASKICDLLEE